MQIAIVYEGDRGQVITSAVEADGVTPQEVGTLVATVVGRLAAEDGRIRATGGSNADLQAAAVVASGG